MVPLPNLTLQALRKLWKRRRHPHFLIPNATGYLETNPKAIIHMDKREIYALFFSGAASTLRDFGLNPKHLGAEIGMTMVLHTSNRQLDYHPHIHIVIPGGGIDKSKRQ